MELELTDQQEELRDGVRAMLAAECPMSLVRAVVEHDAPVDGLWKQMVQQGWPALTIAEAHGGLGLGPVELGVVAEELGRAVAPGPYLATASQFTPAIREVGSADQQDRFLPAVADGSVTGALAVAEEGGQFDPGLVAATATRSGDRWLLDGTKRAVLSALEVDEIVVIAREAGTSGDDGVAAFVIARDDLVVTPVAVLDPTRTLAAVELAAVEVGSERVLGEPGPATAHALRRALDESIVALALETVGTCQAIFDVTLDYAKHREQFGVPIGSFQAIKHKFADMLLALERARATGYFAALTIAEDDERRSLAVSTAKVAAGECQSLLAKEGIQIHGGIGYTWEHDMHLYVRRAKTDAALLGTAADHRARLGERLTA